MFENVCIAVTWIITVAIIAGGVLYGCSEDTRLYYETVNHCVKSGGSWVRGICIVTKVEQR